MKGAVLMNSFDRMIREKARSEKISVPGGFDERIDGIIDGLRRVEGASLNIRKRKSYKPGVFVAAACLILMMLGYMSVIGFDRVYATIAKAVPYVIGSEEQTLQMAVICMQLRMR
jgi:hypothetical protein